MYLMMRMHANLLALIAIIDYNDSNDDTGGFTMASLTIRNLDNGLKARLRLQAAQHGRSMEAEVRQILQQSLMPSASATNFAAHIHQRFKSRRKNVFRARNLRS